MKHFDDIAKIIAHSDGDEFRASRMAAKYRITKSQVARTVFARVIAPECNEHESSVRQWLAIKGQDVTPIKYNPAAVQLARETLRASELYEYYPMSDRLLALCVVAEADVVPPLFVRALRKTFPLEEGLSGRIEDLQMTPVVNKVQEPSSKDWKDFRFGDELGLLALKEMEKMSAIVFRGGHKTDKEIDQPKTARQAANWLKDSLDNLIGSIGNYIFDDQSRGAVLARKTQFPYAVEFTSGVEIELSRRIYLIPTGFSKVMAGMARELLEFCEGAEVQGPWGTLVVREPDELIFKPQLGLDDDIDASLDDIYSR